jgi:molybdate transport system substrate-binding protein
MKPLLFLSVLALVLCSAQSSKAQSEVSLVAPGGIRAPIEQLIPGFEKKTGYKVKATFGFGAGTRNQVVQGAPFDVAVVEPPLNSVLHSRNVISRTKTLVASVSVAVAVKQGAPKPDISTPEAVKRMLLAAKSIAFPSAAHGAGAGVSFEGTLNKLGIYNQIQPKIKPAQGGAQAMAMAASGEVQIGLTYQSEMTEPGIEVVGPLPAKISPPTRMVGFVSAHAKNPAAARALLKYLTSHATAEVYRAHGMHPGH